MEKISSQVQSKPVLGRRAFLGGLIGTGTLAVTALHEPADESWREVPIAALRPRDEMAGADESKELASAETPEAAVESGTESALFQEEVERHAAEFTESLAARESLPPVTGLIEQYFTLPGIDNPVVRAALEERGAAFSYVESRFKETAKSGAGAFGAMQIMPATWKELSEVGEDEHSVVDQIKVSARLLEQAYAYITSKNVAELEYIKHVFFADNDALFAGQFLTPVIINAYNAGMGSLSKLINRFLTEVPSPLETKELFEQGEVMTGYDVFVAMSFAANHGAWASSYREESTDYTFKVYGAHEALRRTHESGAKL